MSQVREINFIATPPSCEYVYVCGLSFPVHKLPSAGQGPCRANLQKWDLAQSPSCDCGHAATDQPHCPKNVIRGFDVSNTEGTFLWSLVLDSGISRFSFFMPREVDPYELITVSVHRCLAETPTLFLCDS